MVFIRCKVSLQDPAVEHLLRWASGSSLTRAGRVRECNESALDSSLYFVLQIEDSRGKHAFIGLGFDEKNEAFDFNVALSYHEISISWHSGTPKSRQAYWTLCFDDERGIQRLLVYEYMPNKILEFHVFNKAYDPPLWKTRLEIAPGVAQRLTYLHEELELQVERVKEKKNPEARRYYCIGMQWVYLKESRSAKLELPPDPFATFFSCGGSPLN
ncbi:hypothetical protein V8G54_029262 [Vigna mungo]|uniref:NECAP PHear domain-containing protein n=1 Tax=Vigna mungo TaxID=3915 RepID=A0AAQ3MU05_VIGMU